MYILNNIKEKKSADINITKGTLSHFRHEYGISAVLMFSLSNTTQVCAAICQGDKVLIHFLHSAVFCLQIVAVT